MTRSRLRRPQKGITMLPAVWEKVFKDYNHLGFKSPSILVETAVVQFLRKKGAIGKRENLDLKKDMKIGQLAKEVGDMHFAAFALRNFNESKDAWDAQYRAGWITKKERDFMVSKEERKMKLSVRAQISREKDKMSRRQRPESNVDRREELRERVRELNRIPEQKDIDSSHVDDDLLEVTEYLPEEEALEHIQRCGKNSSVRENTCLQWRLDHRRRR